MTKFENSWGIHMIEGLAENSLSQLEGRWQGTGRSVYKLTYPYPATFLLIGLSYFQPNPLSYVYPNYSQI
jgi:hypothetical protein